MFAHPARQLCRACLSHRIPLGGGPLQSSILVRPALSHHGAPFAWSRPFAAPRRHPRIDSMRKELRRKRERETEEESAAERAYSARKDAEGDSTKQTPTSETPSEDEDHEIKLVWNKPWRDKSPPERAQTLVYGIWGLCAIIWISLELEKSLVRWRPEYAAAAKMKPGDDGPDIVTAFVERRKTAWKQKYDDFIQRRCGGRPYVLRRWMTYRVVDRREHSWLDQSVNYCTATFAHGGIFHLAFNMLSLQAVFIMLSQTAFKPSWIVAGFVGSGVAAASLHCWVEERINPVGEWTNQQFNEAIRIFNAIHANIQQEQERIRTEKRRNVMLRHKGVPEDQIPRINTKLPRPADERVEKAIQDYTASTLGASSALIALFTFMARMVPNMTVEVWYVPMRIKYMVIGVASLDALFGFTRVNDGLGVAHLGHLSGNAVGLVLFSLFSFAGRRQLLSKYRLMGYWQVAFGRARPRGHGQ